MSTIVFPDHPSPVADAEALRKAFQGTYDIYIYIYIRVTSRTYTHLKFM